MSVSFFKISALFFLSCLFFSCTSKKNITYLQDIDTAAVPGSTLVYEPQLQSDDVLSITVAAENPELTAIFNLPEVQGLVTNATVQNRLKTYLIDNEGYVDFPVLGRLKLAGMTKVEAIKKLTVGIADYIKNPIITIRILNFKISVLGEVQRPGSFTLGSERITVLEALSMAGDLTIYGKRNNILLIRESEGVKSYHRIDLTSTLFLNSPYYYLSQNDILVVEPNNTRVNSSVVGPNVSVILTAVSILTTIMALVIKL